MCLQQGFGNFIEPGIQPRFRILQILAMENIRYRTDQPAAVEQGDEMIAVCLFRQNEFRDLQRLRFKSYLGMQFRLCHSMDPVFDRFLKTDDPARNIGLRIIFAAADEAAVIRP